MKKFRVPIVGLAGVLVALTACAQPEARTHDKESSVTWQDAKAAAQAKTLEIVALIPAGDVVAVDQHETGTLFSCDDRRHRWTGITYVTLVPGADAEATTRKVEARVADLFSDEFEVANYRGITDEYVATVDSPMTGEGYLFGEDEPGTISIDSWSVCFTLPEGMYPGGSF